MLTGVRDEKKHAVIGFYCLALCAGTMAICYGNRGTIRDNACKPTIRLRAGLVLERLYFFSAISFLLVLI